MQVFKCWVSPDYGPQYVSLLSPRKFSRTWTSEDEDKDKDKDLSSKDEDKDLKIGPRGQGLSSRTTTLMMISPGISPGAAAPMELLPEIQYGTL